MEKRQIYHKESDAIRIKDKRNGEAQNTFENRQ